MNTTQHAGGFAASTGNTMINLLVGKSDDRFDLLAGRALQQMMQASYLYDLAVKAGDEAASTELHGAWLLASGALGIISDEVKHYDFLEGQKPVNDDPFFERSGSMSSFGNDDQVYKAAEQAIGSAEATTVKHAELAPKPVKLDFSQGSTDVHSLMDLARQFADSDNPSQFHRVFITITDGESPVAPGDLVLPDGVEETGVGIGEAASFDHVNVRSIDELPELLAQVLRDKSK